MGSVTILSSLGAGHYQIRVNFDNTRVEARKAFITEAIAESTSGLSELETKKEPLVSDLYAARDAFNAYINGAPEEGFADTAQLISLSKAVFLAQAAVEMVNREIRLLKLKKTSLEKERVYFNKYCPATIDTYAWCVEFNEDLTGTMESIEVDYYLRRDNITNQIRDQTGFWLPGAAKTPTNILQHPFGTSVYANWFNVCMLPAAQRYKGRYRVATIIRIDYDTDTCDFYLDSRYNVDRFNSKLLDKEPIVPRFDLYGAQQIEYRDAPIIYMGGGAETFLVGDKVIVDLHAGVGVPTVIGYFSDPRPGALIYLFSDAVNYPFYFPTFGYTRLNLSGKLSESTPLLTNIADYTIGFNNGTVVSAEDFINGTGKRWGTVDGSFFIYTDILLEGKYACLLVMKGLPYADPLTTSMQIYKLGILISDVTFLASGYTGVVSPHHVNIHQVTGNIFGVIKNGNEGYFSGDI